MPLSELNGTTISWRAFGMPTSPPLVLVHGSWSDHHDFDTFAPLMARRFRVIVYDRRGHGRSTAPPGQGSIEEDAADLAALIEAQGAGRAHVFGHSFGAIIALRLAAARPGLIARLAVHEPPLVENLPPGEPAAGAGAKVAARVLPLLGAGDAEAGAREFVEGLVHGPGAWARMPKSLRATFLANAGTFLDEMREPGARRVDLDRLAASGRPVLSTLGGASPALFRLCAGLLADALPAGRHLTIEGAGHVPHVTHAGIYAPLLTRFFTET